MSGGRTYMDTKWVKLRNKEYFIRTSLHEPDIHVWEIKEGRWALFEFPNVVAVYPDLPSALAAGEFLYSTRR